MGGPRLVVVGAVCKTQSFGDILHDLAQRDRKFVKACEVLARWHQAALDGVQEQTPPLRAKDHLRPAKATMRPRRRQKGSLL